MSRKVIGFCEETGCKFEVVSTEELNAVKESLSKDITTLNSNHKTDINNITTDITNIKSDVEHLKTETNGMKCIVQTYNDGYEVYNGVSLKSLSINISSTGKKAKDVVGLAGRLKYITTSAIRFFDFFVPITHFDINKSELIGSLSVTGSLPSTKFNCAKEYLNCADGGIDVSFPTTKATAVIGVGTDTGSHAYIVVKSTSITIDGASINVDTLSLMNLTIFFK